MLDFSLQLFEQYICLELFLFPSSCLIHFDTLFLCHVPLKKNQVKVDTSDDIKLYCLVARKLLGKKLLRNKECAQSCLNVQIIFVFWEHCEETKISPGSAPRKIIKVCANSDKVSLCFVCD